METIPLAVTIFKNSNFLLYPQHTLKLAKKLMLKIKNLKVEIVRQQIRQIWASKIIAKLDLLFKNNLNW